MSEPSERSEVVPAVSDRAVWLSLARQARALLPGDPRAARELVLALERALEGNDEARQAASGASPSDLA
ncbi:MAG: hypothetical protein HYZ29_13980 [Myxococcales bacterium]|nr:hypothetical protein [Myxococcales bacterium]